MSGANNPNWIDPERVFEKLVELNLGTLRITGKEIIRGSHRKVETTCTSCGITKERLVDNLLSGKTKTCICRRGVKNGSKADGRYGKENAAVLGERYDAILQRCRNPRSPSYSNYGARGIELRFSERHAFITWFLNNLYHKDYRGLDIDRIDNNGHYEPGNLRLVPRSVNLRNRRSSRTVKYKGLEVNASDLWHLLKFDYPEFSLSPRSTARYVAEGISWQDILGVRGRGTYKGRPEPQIDPAILSLYGR